VTKAIATPSGYEWVDLTSRTKRDFNTDTITAQTTEGLAVVTGCNTPRQPLSLTLDGTPRVTTGNKRYSVLAANVCHTAFNQDWYKCDQLTGENLNECRATIQGATQ
jgi:hypothetical protein